MKYTIMMSCGHEEVKELFGKSEERARKIEYYKASGLCKECYRRKKDEDNKKIGLLFCAGILPYIDEEDGELLAVVWFEGDTMPNKDNIKSLGGYRWDIRETTEDIVSFPKPKCWNKVIKFSTLKEEVAKAISIGAKITIPDAGLSTMTTCRIALDRQVKWKEKHQQINEIEKPKKPNIVKGYLWNQKIYGKSGSYCIYLTNLEMPITDDQADELRQYLKNKEEYYKKLEEINYV